MSEMGLGGRRSVPCAKIFRALLAEKDLHEVFRKLKKYELV